MQLYTPDYLHTNKSRPVINSAPTVVSYAQNFSVQFSNSSSIDRVVLTRLATSTHGIHADQRQVVLACDASASSINCTAPPNSNIAPPGVYMLFLLYQGVPSHAAYVTVMTQAAAAAAVATAGWAELAAASLAVQFLKFDVDWSL